MTKLEELIEKLCPDGVEYKEIGSIAVLGAGGDVPKARFSAEKTVELNIPIYSNGIEEKAIYGYTDIPKVDEPSITISARGTIGWCALRKEPFYPIVRLIYVTPNNEILIDFLKYVIDTIKFKVPKTGIPQLTIPMVSKYKIPVPPLEVQREIVRILDNFTFLTTELAAELAARQKQYEYYRDLLLTFKPNESTILNERTNELELSGTIRWMKLGDTCVLKAGKAISATEISQNVNDDYIYPCYGGNGLRGYVKNYNQDGEHPIVGRQGALCGNVCYACNKFYATEHAVVVSPSALYNEKFLYYLLDFARLEQYKTAGAQPGLSVARLEKVVLPVPPLEVQQRIVDILDRFDALCNDISNGLPAEIEARQKQYEYYRDKLLTFKELKKEA